MMSPTSSRPGPGFRPTDCLKARPASCMPRHRPNLRPSAAPTWRCSRAASEAGGHRWDQRQPVSSLSGLDPQQARLTFLAVA